MKRFEMNKLRDFVLYLKTYDTFCRSPACRLDNILNEFEVDCDSCDGEGGYLGHDQDWNTCKFCGGTGKEKK